MGMDTQQMRTVMILILMHLREVEHLHFVVEHRVQQFWMWHLLLLPVNTGFSRQILPSLFIAICQLMVVDGQ